MHHAAACDRAESPAVAVCFQPVFLSLSTQELPTAAHRISERVAAFLRFQRVLLILLTGLDTMLLSVSAE